MSLTSDSLAKIEGQNEYSDFHKTRPIKVELWHILNKAVTTGEILPFLMLLYSSSHLYEGMCVVKKLW